MASPALKQLERELEVAAVHFTMADQERIHLSAADREQSTAVSEARVVDAAIHALSSDTVSSVEQLLWQAAEHPMSHGVDLDQWRRFLARVRSQLQDAGLEAESGEGGDLDGLDPGSGTGHHDDRWYDEESEEPDDEPHHVAETAELVTVGPSPTGPSLFDLPDDLGVPSTGLSLFDLPDDLVVRSIPGDGGGAAEADEELSPAVAVGRAGSDPAARIAVTVGGGGERTIDLARPVRGSILSEVPATGSPRRISESGVPTDEVDEEVFARAWNPENWDTDDAWSSPPDPPPVVTSIHREPRWPGWRRTGATVAGVTVVALLGLAAFALTSGNWTATDSDCDGAACDDTPRPGTSELATAPSSAPAVADEDPEPPEETASTPVDRDDAEADVEEGDDVEEDSPAPPRDDPAGTTPTSTADTSSTADTGADVRATTPSSADPNAPTTATTALVTTTTAKPTTTTAKPTTTTPAPSIGVACPAGASTQDRNVIHVAADDVLNVRTGPGTDHPSVATLPPNATGVDVFTGTTSGSWVMLAIPGAARTATGGCGWAHSYHLAG